MADELIDIVDKNNNPTGIQKMKSEAHKKGLFHRSAHIWIYNSNQELLIQLRAKEKKLYPNMWDISAAGHVGAGETPIIAGIRELKEELGIKIKEKDLEFLEEHKDEIKYKNIINNEFSYIYLTELNINPKKLKLQKEEVAKIKFIKIKELEKDIKKHPEKYVQNTWYWDLIIRKIKEKLTLKKQEPQHQQQ